MRGLSAVLRVAVPAEMGDSSEGWGLWGASCVDALRDGEQGAAPRGARAAASPRRGSGRAGHGSCAAGGAEC